MNAIKYILLAFIIVACSQDDRDDNIITIGTLADLVAINNVQIDNVIACASGTENENEFIAYVYPRPGVSDLRYFETFDATADKNDYTQYVALDLETEDLFNGYLKKFTRTSPEEKWVIISFKEEGELHLSNPIRIKHQTQNTLFTDQVLIDQSQTGMPAFSWTSVINDNDAIYFQVVSDGTNELLSGTYTFEDMFQFYKLDNVVLNVTQETPMPLQSQETYQFLLMGVSEDNWVNSLMQRTFVAL